MLYVLLFRYGPPLFWFSSLFVLSGSIAFFVTGQEGLSGTLLCLAVSVLLFLTGKLFHWMAGKPIYGFLNTKTKKLIATVISLLLGLLMLS